MATDRRLGELIEAWRHDHKMDQGQLANLLGVNRMQISRWETRGVPPSRAKIVRLAMKWLAHEATPLLGS